MGDQGGELWKPHDLGVGRSSEARTGLRVKEQTWVPRGDELPNREVNLASTPEALFSSQKWRGDWQLVGEAERCSEISGTKQRSLPLRPRG